VIALTELTIRKLTHPPSGSTKHLDPSLPGFGVRCTVRSKAFFVMYGADRRLKTLGKWPDLSLKDARRAAKQLLANPIPSTTRAPYFHDTRDAFLRECQQRLRPSTVERYHYALKDIENERLDQLSTSRQDPNQLKALKALYNWCIDHGINPS